MESATLTGTQLGSYVVREVIGSGGMAQVYRGLDVNLQRPVAIKVLSSAAAAQPGFAARFQQEARIVAGLYHPNIVQVYNFGQQDGLTYMVQELLRGPTLQAHLAQLAERGRMLARQDVVSVVAQLASALDAAHAAGIVHCDVKPANALWSASGALVLTDFGVAGRVLSSTTLDGTAGIILGTPYYLAPEQAQGLPMTPASDTYALGVVLYELICGQVPFQGTDSRTVLLAHVKGPLPTLHNARPDLPPSVEAVVQRALAKDPAARYPTAGALAQALKRAWKPGHSRLPRALPGTASPAVLAEAWPAPVRLQPVLSAADEAEHDDASPTIHTQVTVVTQRQALASIFPPRRTPVPPSAPVAAVAAPRPGLLHPLLLFWLGTLLLLTIMAGTLVAVRDDYRAALQTPAASGDLIAPTAAPTARVVLAEHLLPTADPGGAALVPTTPPTAANPLEPLVPPDDETLRAGQFAKVRTLIQASAGTGWARIDTSLWLDRLDDVEGALAAGDMQQATLWLEEIQSQLVRGARDGTLQADIVAQVLRDLQQIALNNNVPLAPAALPAGGDG